MKSRKLTRRIKQYIKRYNTATFKSKRILKALNLIENNRLILVKTSIKPEIFLTKGERKVYLTIRGLYCSCYGFNNMLLRNKVAPCYHLLACEMIASNKLPMLKMDLRNLFRHASNSTLEKLWTR